MGQSWALTEAQALQTLHFGFYKFKTEKEGGLKDVGSPFAILAEKREKELTEPLLYYHQKFMEELAKNPLDEKLCTKTQQLIDILNSKVESFIEAADAFQHQQIRFNKRANTFALLRNSLQVALNRKKEEMNQNEV